MIDVTTDGDRAVFTVEGLDKLWSFRSRLELPLAHVTAVEHDPELVGRWWHGVKVLGTDVPGLFAAGDVRHGSVKRCASAVGEGAMAVTFVHRYLEELREA